jgi:hypothetical protein
MRLESLIFFTVTVLVTDPICFSGEFRNLDFEQADTTGLQPPTGNALVEKVLPSWQLSHFDSNSCPVLERTVYFGQQASEVPKVALRFDRLFDGIPECRYFLDFFRTQVDDPVWRLEQTGTIPLNARFLIYRSLFLEMQVDINHQTIPPLNRQGPSALFGYTETATNLVYDISPFYGKEVTLAFVGPFGEQTFPFLSLIHGAAWIDSIQFVSWQPALNVQQSDGQLTISWSAEAFGYDLQTSDALSSAAGWKPFSATPVVVGDEKTVTVVIESKAKFYRLGLHE